MNGDGATRVAQRASFFGSFGSYACHNGKCLDVGLSVGALGLFPDCTVRLHSRLPGEVLWTFQGSGSVAFVE